MLGVVELGNDATLQSPSLWDGARFVFGVTLRWFWLRSIVGFELLVCFSDALAFCCCIGCEVGTAVSLGSKLGNDDAPLALLKLLCCFCDKFGSALCAWTPLRFLVARLVWVCRLPVHCVKVLAGFP